MASIEERRNKAGQLLSYRVVWYRDGKKKTHRVPNLVSAEQWKLLIEEANGDALKAQRALLKKASTKPTFDEVARLHISRLIDVVPDTINTYERMLANHLSPALGDLPVDQIQEDDIARLVKGLIESGRSPKTVTNIHGFLSSVMTTAIRRDLIAENPCESTRLPKARRLGQKNTYLTHDEFAIIYSVADEFYKPFIMFLVQTGLRFGEATALTSADFTDDKGHYSVTVDKAWKSDRRRVKTGERRYLGEPKTDSAYRTLDLDPDTAHLVAPLVASSKPGQQVFKMKRGGVVNSQSFYNRCWKDTIERAKGRGLRKTPRVYDLRHTYASWQLANGLSMWTLSRLMGHENMAVTNSVYSHLLPKGRREGAITAGASSQAVHEAVSALSGLELLALGE